MKSFSAQNYHHWLIPYISWLLCCNGFVLRGPEIMSNRNYLSDFDISFVHMTFQLRLWIVKPGQCELLQWTHYTLLCIISMISVLFFVYCCFLYHPPHSWLYPYRIMLYQKSYNQNWCCRLPHWSMSIIHSTNRSLVGVDCCVDAFLPLFIRMRSFNAILVVLRMVCVESPT